MFSRLHYDEPVLCYVLRNLYLLRRHEQLKKLINLYISLNICFNITFHARHVLWSRWTLAFLKIDSNISWYTYFVLMFVFNMLQYIYFNVNICTLLRMNCCALYFANMSEILFFHDYLWVTHCINMQYKY